MSIMSNYVLKTFTDEGNESPYIIPTLAFAPSVTVRRSHSTVPFSSSLISSPRRHFSSSSASYDLRRCQPTRSCAPSPNANDDTPAPIILSRRSPLKRAPAHKAVPALLQRPEAVLGIVLAAAALLTDFARNLARLTFRNKPAASALSAELLNVEKSIASLQQALDASKNALADSEHNLDVTLSRASTAENAIAVMDDTRAALANARQQAAEVDTRLAAARDALRAQAARRNDVQVDADSLRDERDRMAVAVAQREEELSALQAQLDKLRSRDREDDGDGGDVTSREEEIRAREQQLLDEIHQRDAQLQETRRERSKVEEQAEETAARARALEDEATAASRALRQTQQELERLSGEASAREHELSRVERESAELAQRMKETERLREVVSDMERELGSLQEELRSRDRFVEDASRESDALRGLLAARDAEVEQLAARLDSAITTEHERGGDPLQSNRNLQDVNDSLEAERLALSAEIAHAELAGLDLSEREVDPLDRISKQMDAEGKMLQADVRRAESRFRRQRDNDERKDSAVRDILQSVEDESLQQNAAMQWPPIYPDKDDFEEVGETDGPEDRVGAESHSGINTTQGKKAQAKGRAASTEKTGKDVDSKVAQEGNKRQKEGLEAGNEANDVKPEADKESDMGKEERLAKDFEAAKGDQNNSSELSVDGNKDEDEEPALYRKIKHAFEENQLAYAQYTPEQWRMMQMSGHKDDGEDEGNTGWWADLKDRPGETLAEMGYSSDSKLDEKFSGLSKEEQTELLEGLRDMDSDDYREWFKSNLDKDESKIGLDDHSSGDVAQTRPSSPQEKDISNDRSKVQTAHSQDNLESIKTAGEGGEVEEITGATKVEKGSQKGTKTRKPRSKAVKNKSDSEGSEAETNTDQDGPGKTKRKRGRPKKTKP